MPSSCIGQIVAALYHDSCGDIASNYCVCYARSWLKIARRVGITLAFGVGHISVLCSTDYEQQHSLRHLRAIICSALATECMDGSLRCLHLPAICLL